jgi:hypothetical protein
MLCRSDKAGCRSFRIWTQLRGVTESVLCRKKSITIAETLNRLEAVARPVGIGIFQMNEWLFRAEIIVEIQYFSASQRINMVLEHVRIVVLFRTLNFWRRQGFP